MYEIGNCYRGECLRLFFSFEKADKGHPLAYKPLFHQLLKLNPYSTTIRIEHGTSLLKGRVLPRGNLYDCECLQLCPLQNCDINCSLLFISYYN